MSAALAFISESLGLRDPSDLSSTGGLWSGLAWSVLANRKINVTQCLVDIFTKGENVGNSVAYVSDVMVREVWWL